MKIGDILSKEDVNDIAQIINRAIKRHKRYESLFSSILNNKCTNEGDVNCTKHILVDEEDIISEEEITKFERKLNIVEARKMNQEGERLLKDISIHLNNK